MDRTVVLLLVLAGAAALAAQQAYAATDSDVPDFNPPLDPATQDAIVTNAAMQATPEARLAAFLALIRKFESRNRYNVVYGGGTFTDYSTHPRIKVYFHDPRRAEPGNNNYTTAAGAYQITSSTFDDFSRKTKTTDFSPATQDLLAMAILKQSGAYDAIVAGDISSALNLASKRWASLPGSTSGQAQQTQAAATSAFDDFLRSMS